jgi:hypothetical protein
MTTEALIMRAEAAVNTGGILTFSEDELATLTTEQVDALRTSYGSRLLMRLPEHEIVFQEWLKTQDPAAWRDLWENAETPDYAVSLAFLPEFAGTGNDGAFLICDLQSTDNYFFTPDMLLDKESADYVEAVRTRFLAGGSLSPEQALTVEISAGPMDIWHFAFRRGVDLERAKRAVASLVEDRIVVHVPKADHLSSFFDVG